MEREAEKVQDDRYRHGAFCTSELFTSHRIISMKHIQNLHNNLLANPLYLALALRLRP